MATPLEINITADSSGAVAALKSITGELDKTSISAKASGTAWDQMASQLSKFKTAANSTLNPELLTIYNSKIKELETSMRSFAESEQKTRSATQQQAIAFEEMKVAVNNVDPGIKRLQSSIERATNPASIAAREINNLSRRLLYMGSAAIFGIVSEGFSLLIPLLGELFEGLNKDAQGAQLAIDKLKDLNSINAEANKKAGEQIGSLKELYAAATDVALSHGERLKAVKALQAEFPDYFKNISAENIINGKASGVYKKLSGDIIETAKAMAAFSQIQGIEAQKLGVWEKIAKINSVLISELGRAQSVPQQTSGINQAGTDQLRKRLADDIVTRRNAAIEEAKIDLKSLQDREDFIQKTYGKKDIEVAAVTSGTKKGSENKTNPYEIDLKKIEDDLAKARGLAEKYYGINLEDSKENSTIISESLLKIEEDFLIKKLALDKKYNKLAAEDEKKLIENQNKSALIELKFRQSQDIPNIAEPKRAKSVTESYLETSKIDPEIAPLQVTDDIQKKLDQINKLKDELNVVGQVVAKTLVPVFDDLFDAILSGGDKAFGGLSKQINQLLKQMVEAIAKAAILAGIEALFSGGATTFGSAFTKLIGIKLPGAATGSSYTQGGPLLVGERGPEVVSLPRGSSVTPNAQLSSMNGSQVFIPSLTLRGQDLLVAFSRANAAAGRNG